MCRGKRVMRYLGALFFLVSIASFASDPYASLKDTTLRLDAGTGFILEAPSKSKYLVTNWHVCNASEALGRMQGHYSDGQLVVGPVVKEDAVTDLCAIKVDDKYKALKLGKSLSKRDQLYTRGYPYGILTYSSGNWVDEAEWNYFYSLEEVGDCPSGMRKVRDPSSHKVAGCSVTYFDNVTDLYSRPGSSGSPVVNDEGNIVGVMSSWLKEKDSGGMIPLKMILRFFKDL